ncbi:alpha/beta hydrolase [Candidatus Woesearchaeota archaeon]|nr:alpha/beta hydrolase [Candidatus Woesearchaeota archaeon]
MKEELKKITTKDGLTLDYLVRTPDNYNGKNVVMHPAASMNSSSLKPIYEALNKWGYSAIVLNPRWNNPDAPHSTSAYELEKCTDDLDRVMKRENIKKPILFGYSTGFPVMADYAAKTGNVERMIEINGSYNLSKTQNPVAFHFFDKVRKIKDRDHHWS